jgi:hypothetical protein
VAQPVHYIPIITTLVALAFTYVLVQHYRARPSNHVLWWMIGVFMFGVGTFTEGSTTLFGWNEPLFRSWYVAGALLGGAPLAQGTVYLMLKRRTANILTAVLVTYILVAATFVWMTPINYELVEAHRLTGSVMEWSWVRLFSPFINIYAVIFLVGGAILSAVRYARDTDTSARAIGNALIAVGAILPGIGGTATRMGHTEVLYVMELLGLILIWWGYRFNVNAPPSTPAKEPDSASERATATV